jgi:hypothetical protein
MEKGKKVETKKLQVQVESLIEPMELGNVFMKSGLFKDVKSQAQAVVKILAGRELGLAPLESMTNIYMVNGKVALQAKIIGSLIKKSEKYDYTVTKLDNEECSITFYGFEQRDSKVEKTELGKSIFTKKDAALAGIVNKDVWKNYPRNMLFARALSNGARWYTSDVFCGYTAEELETPREVTSVVTIDGKGKVKENGEA